MSINQRAKDMGVSDLVKRIEKLEEENKSLKEEIKALRGKINAKDLKIDYRHHRAMKSERGGEDNS